MDIQNIVTDQDTELLDAEITKISNGFAETYYFDNDQSEELELLVAKAMKRGELYERQKWQASANRDGFVLVPKAPCNQLIVAIERKVEDQLKASAIDADPFRLDGEKIYQAMIEAAEEK